MKMENLHNQHSLLCFVYVVVCYAFYEIFIFILQHRGALRWVMQHKHTLDGIPKRSLVATLSPESVNESNIQTSNTPDMEAGYAQCMATSENQPFSPRHGHRKPNSRNFCFAYMAIVPYTPCWLMSDCGAAVQTEQTTNVWVCAW
jgi:hypothetical protein